MASVGMRIVGNGLLYGSVLSVVLGCSAHTGTGEASNKDPGANASTGGASSTGGAGSGTGGAPGARDASVMDGGATEDAAPRGTGGQSPAVDTDAGGAPTMGGGVDIDVTGAKLIPNHPGVKSSPKLDLLLVVDNSISMSDKQDVLARSLPDLVARIADPSSGINDLHVGVITSSLGGHGARLCKGSDTGTLEEQEADDHGHFIATRPRFDAGGLPASQRPSAAGILTWTPAAGTTALVGGIRAMVESAGELGCGLESQLEAMYHALVDPKPYASITIANCPGSTESCATPTGLDTVLLEQRKAFLRPDSVVAIIELTDENDCSIRSDGQYYYAARDDLILPHGTSACAKNPNDACCYWCNGAVPDGCDPDPSCSTQTSAVDNPPNLRCFHDKERFGIDYLYPTARYASALSRTELCTSRIDLVPAVDCPDADGDGNPDLIHNPLFWDTTDQNKPAVRDPTMVYLLGILGVPYQDLQSAPSATRVDYRRARDLAASKAWDAILGNASPSGAKPPILPTDALMIESIDPRSGFDGEMPPQPLVGTDGGFLANPVNGHEWVNSERDDLQYACIFPLRSLRDCAALAGTGVGCDCKPGNEADLNPICQSASGAYSSNQAFAKAYPGLRELDVIQRLGDNGLAASICTRNITDDTRPDYGYRPAIDLLLNQIRLSSP